MFDQVTGAHPTVDLHLTDVPSGAFSQAQVELRAQLSGWLLSMTVACWVNSILLLALTVTMVTRPEDGDVETAVTLLVVFVSFASTVVTQQDAHPMLGRLLWHAKGLAGLSSLCALGAATLVALSSWPDELLWLPTAVSWLCAGLLAAAAFRSRPRRPDRADVSPWDFTVPLRSSAGRGGGTVRCPGPVDARPPDDATARRKLGLDRPAIQVATAEGVRHRTRWSTRVEAGLAVRLHEALLQADVPNVGRAGTRFTATVRTELPATPPTIDLSALSQRQGPASAAGQPDSGWVDA